MLNVRDTIIAGKIICFYLAAAPTIVEGAEKARRTRKDNLLLQKDPKESMDQGMVDQKARVWTV